MAASIAGRKVAVLLGGTSAERDVSLHTGEQVIGALRAGGAIAEPIDTADPAFLDTLRDGGFDVAFICLHGRFGEDGTMQGLLEILGIPYIGSGVLASALAIDKVMSKHLFAAAGLRSPEYVALTAGEKVDHDGIAAALGDKSVVKPANEGSSVGMTIVHTASELPAAIEKAFRHDTSVLVERFVPGVEVTVGVLGMDEPFALPTLEIVPENEFYDYESKYVPGMSRHIIPARVSEAARAECQRLALAAHRVLGCRGLSRADTIVTADDTVYLLEVNTIPGMTSTSLLPDSARAAGIEFPELCAMLVSYALEVSGS
ncbi:MAG: D-alanine--D-alanine ligase [Actinobacteria bacterium]|nr:MAG: D-alanine--D-alanine ligase [Actinomycetota bacterium]